MSFDRSPELSNTREQYECLGGFVEAFENMVDIVRITSIRLLTPALGEAKPEIIKQYKEWLQVPFSIKL